MANPRGLCWVQEGDFQYPRRPASGSRNRKLFQELKCLESLKLLDGLTLAVARLAEGADAGEEFDERNGEGPIAALTGE